MALLISALISRFELLYVHSFNVSIFSSVDALFFPTKMSLGQFWFWHTWVLSRPTITKGYNGYKSNGSKKKQNKINVGHGVCSRGAYNSSFCFLFIKLILPKAFYFRLSTVNKFQYGLQGLVLPRIDDDWMSFLLNSRIK